MSPLRVPTLIVACACAAASGCTLGNSGIRRGAPITHVQLDLGLPDVISDESGDTARSYVPSNRPAEEWPWDAPRTFYYLDRNLAVTFVRGKAVRAADIPDARRQRLLSLVRVNQPAR